MIAKGADVNEKDNAGYTALIQASLLGYHNIASVLIANGANLDAQENAGCTALMTSATLGHIKMLEMLIVAKANLDLQDTCGFSALMKAVHNKAFECAKMLIRAGADRSLRNQIQMTAADIASLHLNSFALSENRIPQELQSEMKKTACHFAEIAMMLRGYNPLHVNRRKKNRRQPQKA